MAVGSVSGTHVVLSLCGSRCRSSSSGISGSRGVGVGGSVVLSVEGSGGVVSLGGSAVVVSISGGPPGRDGSDGILGKRGLPLVQPLRGVREEFWRKTLVVDDTQRAQRTWQRLYRRHRHQQQQNDRRHHLKQHTDRTT